MSLNDFSRSSLSPPITPTSAAQEAAHQNLQAVAKEKGFNRYLIVSEDGKLEQTHFFKAKWEGFKGLFKKNNLRDTHLIKLKALQLVVALGKEWTNTPSEIALVKALAARAGLTEDPNLNFVIDTVAESVLKQDPSETDLSLAEGTALLNKAFEGALDEYEFTHQQQLKRYPDNILKTQTVQQRIFPTQSVAPDTPASTEQVEPSVEQDVSPPPDLKKIGKVEVIPKQQQSRWASIPRAVKVFGGAALALAGIAAYRSLGTPEAPPSTPTNATQTQSPSTAPTESNLSPTLAGHDIHSIEDHAAWDRMMMEGYVPSRWADNPKPSDLVPLPLNLPNASETAPIPQPTTAPTSVPREAADVNMPEQGQMGILEKIMYIGLACLALYNSFIRKETKQVGQRPSLEVRPDSKARALPSANGATVLTRIRNVLHTMPSKVADTLLPSPQNVPTWEKLKYYVALKEIKERIATKVKEASQKDPLWYEKDLGSRVLPVIQMLDLVTEERFEASAQIYGQFLEALRETIDSPFYINAKRNHSLEKQKNPEAKPDEALAIVWEICEAMFTRKSFYSFHEQTVQLFGVDVSQDSEISAAEFETIDHADPSIKMDWRKMGAQKLAGHFATAGFDPHGDGNLPHEAFVVEVGGRPVTYLRMGSPTIEKFGKEAVVNAEFRGYLDSLASKNKSHLYILLQNRVPLKGIRLMKGGDESGRTTALEQLKAPNYHAVGLAQDSDFYKQKGSKEAQGAREFLDEFFDQMFPQEGDPDTGFYFPDKWKIEDDFKPGIKRLLDEVHYVLYDAKKELSWQERLDFIEIFYVYLTIFLADYAKVDSLNISCKDDIDRGGKQKALALQVLATIQGIEEKPEFKRAHRRAIHGPVIQARARAILPGHGKDRAANGRRERLLSALELLKDPDVKNRMKMNIKAKDGKPLIDIEKRLELPGMGLLK